MHAGITPKSVEEGPTGDAPILGYLIKADEGSKRSVWPFSSRTLEWMFSIRTTASQVLKRVSWDRKWQAISALVTLNPSNPKP